MFNNTIKSEYNITHKKLNNTRDTIKNNSMRFINKITNIFKSHSNIPLKIYTNKNTINTIHTELNNKYKNNYVITFDNNKYSINIYLYESYENCYYIIDCFHMNTITLQNYKKLIYEIYDLIINQKTKNKYLNIENPELYIIVDNINKLEENKVKVIQQIFCNKIFNSSKNNFNYSEIHYYIKSHENVFFNKYAELFLDFYEQQNILANEDEIISTYKYDEFINYIMSLHNTKTNELYKFIQNEFCNKKYSIDLILQLYKGIINKIVSSKPITLEKQLKLMETMNIIFEEFNNYKIETMKHLIYENFIIKSLKVYTEISSLTS